MFVTAVFVDDVAEVVWFKELFTPVKAVDVLLIAGFRD